MIYQLALQMWHHNWTWYPNGTPKNFNWKYKLWAFKKLVNHLYSHPISKIASHSTFMIFWYFIDFAKMLLFHWNLWGILQSLQECKITLRLHNDTCNTAFESLDVIVLIMIIFGYHGGTQNTQNFIYMLDT